MSKSDYKIRWFEYFILCALALGFALAVLFNWFSYMIGDRSYAELSSSKTSGLAYLVSNLEKSNWKYIIVIIFSLCCYIFAKLGLREKNKK